MSAIIFMTSFITALFVGGDWGYALEMSAKSMSYSQLAIASGCGK